MPTAANPSDNRTYRTSVLPTLRDGYDTKAHRDVMLAVYAQTCQTWRQLVDVRFKLLALVPGVSLASLAIVLATDGNSTRLPGLVRVLFALIGLASTAGLWIYDVRNSELYNELISRARKIEEELGLHTGAFLGRPEPKRSWIRHGMATGLIYGAAIAAWAGALLFALIRAIA
jgi:hypothetical protein